MKKIHRRLIFWLFFVLFAVSTPIAVLYSQGYRFDQYRQIFIHSGSITVKSIPASANVYLNGKLQTGSSLDIINNSFTLNGLRPGSYSLQVSADGYQEWVKQVEVHSGISSEFWNVFLAPQKLSPNELSATKVERFFPSPFGKYVAFVNNDQNKFHLWSYDVENNESTAIYEGDELEFSKNKSENLEWNFKERLLLSPVSRNDRKDYLISDLEKEYDSFFLSNSTELRNFSSARWSSENQWTLYFLARKSDEDRQNLYSYDVSTKELREITEDVLAFDFSGSSIYAIRSNNVIYKFNIDGKEINQVTVSPISDEELGNSSRLIIYDEDRQAVISETGGLFVRNNETEDTIRKIADNVNEIQFSDDGKKMLFWNKNEVSVLFLRDWDVQPQRKENEIQEIMRSSSSLDNVFWFQDYEHILFTYQNKIKIIELDPRDHRVSMNLFENNLDSFPAAYDSRNNNYYYIGDGNVPGTLYQIQLLPRPGLFGQQ
ncbi:MAG: PEGA domain-containing protein [Parcubacteria group bacterium]|jgi:hypothetical protein